MRKFRWYALAVLIAVAAILLLEFARQPDRKDPLDGRPLVAAIPPGQEARDDRGTSEVSGKGADEQPGEPSAGSDRGSVNTANDEPGANLTVSTSDASDGKAPVPARVAEGAANDKHGGIRKETHEERIARLGREMTTAKAEAERRAKAQGIPIREVYSNGQVIELQRYDGDRPVYYATENVSAAESTGANLLRDTTVAPFGLKGQGRTVGIWDGGLVRAGHGEFGTRVQAMPGQGLEINHATHVAGTIGAAGVLNSNAKGMAPLASMVAYDWNQDLREMAIEAELSAVEGSSFISNHSYGNLTGWTIKQYPSGNSYWRWMGGSANSGANSEDPLFGLYNKDASDLDDHITMYPSHSVFVSAGNHRADGPVDQDWVFLDSNETDETKGVLYDPSTMPKADGPFRWDDSSKSYVSRTDGSSRPGYETVEGMKVSKNAIVIGAVTDISRFSSDGKMSGGGVIGAFSSWGPTDDGRIKPDLVANGVDVFSTLADGSQLNDYPTDLNQGGNWYGTRQGTSMACPNATGSAALLLELYAKLFPSSPVMAASTLKGLLIHTADDLGTAVLNTPDGPDYKFGWGAINVREAAKQIVEHEQDSTLARIVEATLQSVEEQSVVVYPVAWNGQNGAEPLKATLCWTDPPGAEQTSADARSPNLVNDLDLYIISPDKKTYYYPYVMPYVGNWAAGKLGVAAKLGTSSNYDSSLTNKTDNVEMILIDKDKMQEGLYSVVITHKGLSQNAEQKYSLFVSGQVPLLLVGPDSLARPYGEERDLTVSYYGYSPESPISDQKVEIVPQQEPIVSLKDADNNAHLDAGTYVIQAVGGSDPRYQFVRETGFLTVVPRPIAVEVSDMQIAPGRELTLEELRANTLVSGSAAWDDPLGNGDIEYDFLPPLDLMNPAEGTYTVTPKLSATCRNYRLDLNGTRVASLTVGEPQDRVRLTGGGSDLPAVAIGPGGDLHLVYRNNGELVYRRMDRDGKNPIETRGFFPIGLVEPKIAVDTAGNVHIVVISPDREAVFYAKVNPTGGIAFKDSFLPVNPLVASHIVLSDIDLALDPVTQQPVVGAAVLYSLPQMDLFTDLPSFPGYSLGEINAYLVSVGVWASSAIPRYLYGGTESFMVMRMQVDDASNNISIREKKTVHWEFTQSAALLEMNAVALDIAPGGTAHVAWRKDELNGSYVYGYKTDAQTTDAEPLYSWEETYPASAPEIRYADGEAAITWVDRNGDVWLVVIKDGIREQTMVHANAMRQPVGLARVGATWQIYWSERSAMEVRRYGRNSGGQLVELPGGDGIVAEGVLRNVSVGNVAGDHAVVFVDQGTIPEVYLYQPTFQGTCYAIEACSTVWETSSPGSLDDPVLVRCAPDLLTQKGNYRPVQGVIADGVTPLLFRLSGLDSGTSRYRVAVEAAGGVGQTHASVGRIQIAAGLSATGSGAWEPAVPALRVHEFELATCAVDGKVFLLFGAMTESDLHWPAIGASQEIEMKLVVTRVDGSNTVVGEVPFRIGRPPVALVHGYNADNSSWDEKFLEELEKQGLTDGVIMVDYGQDLVADAPRQHNGYKQNTTFNLEALAPMLSDELKRQLEQPMRSRWAMTRYDVVGHSQGGVLLRMLCKAGEDEMAGKEDPSRFANQDNFFRGRFRRVVTIGSPHGGSRLAHFLMAYRDAMKKALEDGGGSTLAPLLFTILDWQAPNLLQDKFDPFPTIFEPFPVWERGSIGWVNQSGEVPIHEGAKFHFVSTLIDHERPAPAALFTILGLHGDERFQKVMFRNGTADPFVGNALFKKYSDGVVDYHSHFGGGNPTTDSNITEMCNTHAELSIAHAGPTQLFQADRTQGNSVEIAWTIRELLRSGDATKFGSFLVPAQPDLLDAESMQAEVDKAVAEAERNQGMVDLAVELLSTEDAFGMIDLLVAATRLAALPQRDGDEGASEWMVTVHSPDPDAKNQCTWSKSTEFADALKVSIPAGMAAQVVVIAMKTDAVTGMSFSQPTVVHDTLGTLGVGLAISGLPEAMRVGETYEHKVLLRMADGGTTEYHFANPERMVVESSDPGIIRVEGGRIVAAGKLGQATLTAHYEDWVGTATVSVMDTPPTVRLVTPANGIEVASGDTLPIEVAAEDLDGAIAKVEVYLNGNLLHTFLSEPYIFDWPVPRPGAYEIRARAIDDHGNMGVSLPRSVSVKSAPPTVSWDGLVPNRWYAGVVPLLATVVDGDTGDTATVTFEFSLNSTDGFDGEWGLCAAPVSASPYAVSWYSQPASGVDEMVWLRVYAVDGAGLRSNIERALVRVDNGATGVTVSPHPGETEMPLDSAITIHFEARPLDEFGNPLSDEQIKALFELRDSAGGLVEVLVTLLDGGATIILQPVLPLGGVRDYMVTIKEVLTVGGETLPVYSTRFTTTHGSPAGLAVTRLPLLPTAGEIWNPSVEVTIVDSNGNRVDEATGLIDLVLTSPDDPSVLASYQVEAAKGVALFRAVSSEQAGSVVLEVSHAGLELHGGTRATVLPGALGSFTVVAPAAVQTRQPVALIVTAIDVFGNLKTDYAGTPLIETSDLIAGVSDLLPIRFEDSGRRIYGDAMFFMSYGAQWLEIQDGTIHSNRALVDVTNSVPGQPTPVSPQNNQAVGLEPTLAGALPAGFRPEILGAVQWQVSADSLFMSILWDSGVAASQLTVQVPTGVLAGNTRYYWRMRVKDAPGAGLEAKWSPWSWVAAFRTAHAFPFVDDFSGDRGWEGFSADGWGVAAAEVNSVGAPTEDVSPGADNRILAFMPNEFMPPNLLRAYEVVSPAIDCSREERVELSFHRWLQIDTGSWAMASVAVSKDRLNWQVIWANGRNGVIDQAWQKVRFDISDVAAGQPTVYVRFSTGPQFYAYDFCGWNIDEVSIERGRADIVTAELLVEGTKVSKGDTFEVYLMMQENVVDVRGILGASFNVNWDASRLQLVSPADAARIVNAPFNAVTTEGVFGNGSITGLSGIGLAEGVGDGVPVAFGTLRFRALQAGPATIQLSPGASGAVLPSPVGVVSPLAVLTSPLSVQIDDVLPPPLLEFALEGPGDPVSAGGKFEVVVWARENDPTAPGFLGGAVDFFFDDSLVGLDGAFDPEQAVDPVYQSLGFVSGYEAAGRIDELGGVTLTEGLGDGQFVRFCTVTFVAKTPGKAVFALDVSQTGLVLAYPRGEISPYSVDFGTALEIEITDWPVARVAVPPVGISNRTSLSLTVGGYDITEYRYALDGAPWSTPAPVSQPLNLQALANGPHRLAVLGANAAGTWQNASAPTVSEWVVDATPPGVPSLARATPTIGVWSPAPQVSFDWNPCLDNSGHAPTYSILWTNDEHDTLDGVDRVGFLPTLKPYAGCGEYWLLARSHDLAGNASAVARFGPWRFDNIAPVLTVASSASIADVTAFPASVIEEHSGLASVLWRAVGANKELVVIANAGSPTAAVSAKANGHYSIEVVATDHAGNAATKLIDLEFKRTAPVIEQVMLEDGAVTTANRKLEVAVRVRPGDAMNLEYRAGESLEGARWVPARIEGGMFRFEYLLTGQDGNKTVLVQVRDAAYPYPDFVSIIANDSIYHDSASWSLEMAVSNAFNDHVMIGVSALTTDGFDQGVDQLMAQVPVYINHVWLSDIAGAGYYKSIRGRNQQVEWILIIGAISGRVELSWDATAIPAWLDLKLTPAKWAGGEWIDTGTPVSMKDQATLSVSDALGFFRISGLELELPDMDQDGLLDAWEIEHFGDLRFDGTDDPDRDGVTNRLEFLANLDPNNGNSRFHTEIMKSATMGGLELKYGPCVTGLRYVVESSVDLVTWNRVALPLLRNEGDYRVAGIVASGPRGFFRVQVSEAATPGDADGDELPDQWEMTHFGDLRFDGTDDPDRDGVTNRLEFLANLDPNNGNSRFHTEIMKSATMAGLELKYGPCVTGLRYVVEGSVDLVTWHRVDLPLLRNEGDYRVAGIVASGPRGFFRVQVSEAATPGDMDGDEMPDQWEMTHFGGLDNPLGAPEQDPDHDGQSNWMESMAQTNPLSSTSFFRPTMARKSQSGFVLKWLGQPQVRYRVQCSKDMMNWTELAGSRVEGNGDEIGISDPDLSAAARFYRIEILGRR
ncbi:MAG: S8 family serine peptidase [Verrucomicrobia bacterium]|nr:S8 family serine peptidase [Verrucomicrobiota bacterium]